MKLFLRLATVFVTCFLLLVIMLFPVWASPMTRPATHDLPVGPPASSDTIRAQGVITFTPVATVFLPIVAKSPGSDSAPPSSSNLKIVKIVYNPDGSDAEGEYVEIQNLDTATADMTGWTLRDAAETVYTFPSFTIASQAKVKVWVKSGSDTATDLYWGRNSAIWNNSGDTATLKNAAGVDIDSCTYPGGAPGSTDCN